MNKYHCYS